MRWAPIFFLFFGYWALGNKQIFENEVKPIAYSNAPVNTGHKGWPYVGPDLPVFICAVVYLFALIFETLWNVCLVKCKISDPPVPEEVDEKLGNYWECVSSAYRKKWLAEEVYNTNKLNIRMMGDQVFEKMRTFIGKKKVIKTTPNYDILANPKYQTLFQWVPLELRNSPEDAKFSDLVTQILKVGYKRDDKPIEANFD